MAKPKHSTRTPISDLPAQTPTPESADKVRGGKPPHQPIEQRIGTALDSINPDATKDL